MKKKKIVIFTANELRHLAFINYLKKTKGIEVVGALIEKKNKVNITKSLALINHFRQRNNMESNYFKGLKIKKREKYIYRCNKHFISSKRCLDLIKELKPDLIVVYGSSIIRGSIINIYKNKILNVHLGLSPYYRGSGTNIFPLINSEPEYVGVTFMFLDKGIDTGNIIHQIRPKYKMNDSIHDIGNKLILRMFKIYKKIILNFEKIIKIKPIKIKNSKYYKKKDFTEKTLQQLKKNFDNGLIKNYLKIHKKRERTIKLIKQSWI